MTFLKGLMILFAMLLISTGAQANPFAPFAGSGGASGTMWLVGKSGADSAKCSRNGGVVGNNGLSFSLSCSGGRSFSLSCSFKSNGASVSGWCNAGFVSLKGNGSVSGKTMQLSFRSSIGTHANMTITPSSLSFRSPDAKYVKSLQISSR